jgi:hypothetical protein
MTASSDAVIPILCFDHMPRESPTDPKPSRRMGCIAPAEVFRKTLLSAGLDRLRAMPSVTSATGAERRNARPDDDDCLLGERALDQSESLFACKLVADLVRRKGGDAILERHKFRSYLVRRIALEIENRLIREPVIPRWQRPARRYRLCLRGRGNERSGPRRKHRQCGEWPATD